jgi:membrane AbrB-like protein
MLPGSGRGSPVWLLAVGALVAGLALGLAQTPLPAPALFAGFVGGLLHTLGTRSQLRVPPLGVSAAQGVVGVEVGLLLRPSTLTTIAADWLPVVLITVATLALSLLAGVLLARWSVLDRRTAALGMISGGAAGITALSDDLGADSRLVAVLQYARLLLVVVLMPVAVVVLFGGRTAAAAPVAPTAAWARDVVVVAALGAAGTWAGGQVRLPAASLLGPLLLAAPLAAAGVGLPEVVPAPLGAAAFALLGAQVGLRFTPGTLNTLRRAAPVALALVVALILASGALGVLLSALTGMSPLDGYLATTPGGLYVVLAVAAGSGADTTSVLAVQVLRLLVMLLAAPPLARMLERRG